VSEQANHPKLAGAGDVALHIWWSTYFKRHIHTLDMCFELSVVFNDKNELGWHCIIFQTWA
jgi:hypothetical protein